MQILDANMSTSPRHCTYASLMLPPTSLAYPFPFKGNFMLNGLSNDECLAVSTLNTPIVTSPYHFRIVGEVIRPQWVFAARKRLQRNVIAWAPP